MQANVEGRQFAYVIILKRGGLFLVVWQGVLHLDVEGVNLHFISFHNRRSPMV